MLDQIRVDHTVEEEVVDAVVEVVVHVIVRPGVGGEYGTAKFCLYATLCGVRKVRGKGDWKKINCLRREEKFTRPARHLLLLCETWGTYHRVLYSEVKP